MRKVNVTYRGGRASFLITNPKDHIQKHWLKGVFYESLGGGLLDWTYRHLPKGLTVLDVGAHMGNHTVFWAKLMGARVVAFEPDKDNFRMLQKHIRLNRVQTRVMCRPVAVGEHNTRAYLTPYGVNNTGMGRVTMGMKGDHSVQVPMVALSTQHKTVDLIKIDVEGGEVGVILGAMPLIERTLPVLAIETDQPAVIAAHLAPMGYRFLETPVNPTPTYIFYPPNYDGSTNG